MKRFRNPVALLLVLVLVISMVAACTKGDAEKDPVSNPDPTDNVADAKDQEEGQTQDPDPSEDVSNPFEEHMEISIAIWDAEKSISEPGEDAIYDTIREKLNIDMIPINVTWDDYEQKIQVWAASSQLPDVFAIDAAEKPYYKSWVKEEIVKSLPDDLSAYPSLKEVLDGADYQAYKWPEDGKFYGIPRPTYSSSKMWAHEKALYIRQDWMEELGYNEDPSSLEEMIDLLKNLSEKNPEGKPNVTGVTAFDSTFLGWFMTPYNGLHIFGGSGWMRYEGKWMPSIFDPKVMEGVRALGQLWDSGVIDRDIATISGQEGLDKFASGRAAALLYGGSPATVRVIAEKFAKNYPDKKYSDSVKMVHPYKNSDGEFWYAEATTPWSESYINGNVEDDKMDRILRLFDYLLSEEGLNLMRYGIEDVDYKKEGDEIVILRSTPLLEDYPFVDHAMNFLATWDQDFDFVNPGIDEAIRKEANDMLQWYWDNGKPSSELTDFRFSFIDFPSKDKATARFEEDVIKAMMSNDTEKTYQEALDKYMKNGYDKIIEEFNEAAKAAGIEP